MTSVAEMKAGYGSDRNSYEKLQEDAANQRPIGEFLGKVVHWDLDSGIIIG